MERPHLGLVTVSPGMDRLAGLFSERVRARALGVSSERLELLHGDEVRLLAAVTGAARYLAGFRRSGTTLYYACTCPFFVEEQAGCKHLWALVRHAPRSAVVLSAAGCAVLEPSIASLHGEPPEAPRARRIDDGGALAAQLARSLLVGSLRR